MRFHLGDIPESAEFIPDASWRPLPESSAMRFHLIAFPIGRVAAAIARFWFLGSTLDTCQTSQNHLRVVVCQESSLAPILREPADSLKDRFNVVSGWLPAVTFTLGGT